MNQVGYSSIDRRGLFAHKDFAAGEVVERAHVLVVTNDQEKIVEQTPIGDYMFWWDDEHAAVAFGPISFANHSDSPNCDLMRDYSTHTVFLEALRPIRAGDEITFDYEYVWFDAR
jgi:hypothetical protein